MEKVFRQIPLYRFLAICNDKCSGKKVLDCGAGGNQPPLSLFSNYGYETYGIENNSSQIDAANNFSKSIGQFLNIIEGDMRSLPYKDSSFDVAYSYNSIFHMRKVDIRKSILEIRRVLKKEGLLFVNFLSIDDSECGSGVAVGENEFEQCEEGTVIHSYFNDNEADHYFADMSLIHKEKRIVERYFRGELVKQGFIDYIVQEE